tara:strand:+ start:226 stop:429 length:204 start_codon:yes stop_codon:yes gene_type:complete
LFAFSALQDGIGNIDGTFDMLGIDFGQPFGDDAALFAGDQPKFGGFDEVLGRKMFQGGRVLLKVGAK